MSDETRREAFASQAENLATRMEGLIQQMESGETGLSVQLEGQLRLFNQWHEALNHLDRQREEEKRKAPRWWPCGVWR